MKRGSATPPLKVMIASLLLASILLTPLISIAVRDLKEDEENMVLANLRTGMPTGDMRDKTTHPGVVAIVIGSSLLKSATDDMEKVPERYRPDPNSTPLHITKAYLKAPQLSALVWDGALDAAVAAVPDILVIEKTALFFQPRRSTTIRNRIKTRIREWIVPLFSRFQPILQPGVATALAADNSPHTETMGTRVVEFESQAHSNAEWNSILRFGFRPGFKPFLATCLQKGIRVLVVDVPNHASLPSRLTPRQQKTVRRHLEGFERHGLLEMSPCPLEFTADDYTDGRHMNSQGSRKYSRWLINRLQG